MIHTQPHSVCLVRATLSPTHVENSVYLHTFKFWPLRTHVFLTHCVVVFYSVCWQLDTISKQDFTIRKQYCLSRMTKALHINTCMA